MGPNVPAYLPAQIPPAYREYRLNEGNIPLGSQNQLQIGNDGSLKGIWITAEIAFTSPDPAPDMLTDGGQPFNVITNVVLTVGGLGQTVLCPGELLAELNKTYCRSFGRSITYPTELTEADRYVVNFDLYIPVCVRDPEVFGAPADYLGLTYTGDKKVQVNLQLQQQDVGAAYTGSAGGLGTGESAPTGNFVIASQKLDTPSPDEDPALLAAISWYHAIQEDTIAETLMVSNAYQPSVNQTRIYLRLLTIVRDSGVFVGSKVTSIGAQVSGIIVMQQPLDEPTLNGIEAARYGQLEPGGSAVSGDGQSVLNPGVHALDFSYSQTRDQWFAVDDIAEFTVTEAADTSGANQFSTVADYCQPSTNAQKYIAVASPEVLKEAGVG